MDVFDLLLTAGFTVIIDGHRKGRSASERANHATLMRQRRSP
jgi:hypothetical protein